MLITRESSALILEEVACHEWSALSSTPSSGSVDASIISVNWRDSAEITARNTRGLMVSPVYLKAALLLDELVACSNALMSLAICQAQDPSD
jgi:hypothetical protein